MAAIMSRIRRAAICWEHGRVFTYACRPCQERRYR